MKRALAALLALLLPSLASAQTRTITELGGGAGVMTRRLDLEDGVTPNMRDYHGGGTAFVAADAAVYPWARRGGRFLPDLGVVAQLAHAIAPASRLPDGRAVDTSWRWWRAGARGRVALAKHELWLEGTYGGWDYGFAEPAELSGQLLSVAYRFVRPAAGLRLRFGRVEPFAELGWRFLVSRGALDDRLPSRSSGGADVSVGAAVVIGGGFSALAAVDYVRWFHAFAPRPGDTWVAGGALDQAYGARLALRWEAR
jgi:hypothetical protein